MLLPLIIIPILGIITIIINKEKSREIAFITSIFNIIYIIYIWSIYDSTYKGYQFITEFKNNLSIYEFNIGLDGISLYFIILTSLLISIVILSNWYSIKESIKSYYIIILILEILLISVFIVLDLIMFYVLFESILPPLFLLIGIWGSNRKIEASYHIFIYTLAGSLFMLLAFLTIYQIIGTTNYEKLIEIKLDFKLEKILWLAIFISIMVKSPLFPFHLWLPLCHSEAPLGGSILLAGIILKLAIYAILWILLPILPSATLYFTPLVYTITIITIIYASLTTLRQIDLKVIVAYSSISHMAITIMGILSNQIQGINGGILLSISHGLVSPALFILLGGVLYDRYHTWILFYYKGLITFMPLFSLYFFLFTLANMATPLSGNFIGEFLSLQGSYERSFLATILASSSIFLTAAYSIFLFNWISGGIKSSYIIQTNDLNRWEFFILSFILIFVIILGLYPYILFEGLNQTISSILIY